jgi:ABC-type Fe3+-hydroxamate transport system substrate-binding protein
MQINVHNRVARNRQSSIELTFSNPIQQYPTLSNSIQPYPTASNLSNFSTMLSTDMLGRAIEVPAQPRRIISLVPSQTELLADLGLDEEVVGITKFCVHPQEWFRAKERVGGTKQLHPDKIAALHPDLIIANKEENERSQIEQLAQTAPVWISDILNLANALDMISRVGMLCGRAGEAARICSGIESGFQSLALLAQQQAGRPLRVAYAIWRQPWMWVGAGTFIHDMLQRCGWENVLADLPRYPEMSLDELRQRRPDLILLSSEPYPFSEKHLPELHDFLPGAKPVLVDGETFSWYGSRLLQAPEYLASLMQSC